MIHQINNEFLRNILFRMHWMSLNSSHNVEPERDPNALATKIIYRIDFIRDTISEITRQSIKRIS